MFERMKEATEDYANKQEKYPIPDIGAHFNHNEDRFIISLMKETYKDNSLKQKDNVDSASFASLCKRIIKKALPDASSDKDTLNVVLT